MGGILFTQPNPQITVINEQEKIYKLVYTNGTSVFEYTGEMLDGMLHGKGQIKQFKNDELFYEITDVTFNQGIVQGEVTIRYALGYIYTGSVGITNDYKMFAHGNGMLKTNALLEIGTFSFGEFQKGLLCSENYIGEWDTSNNLRHGVGIHVCEQNPNFDCRFYQNGVVQYSIGSLRNKSIEELFGRPLPEEFVQRVNSKLI